MRLLRLPCQVEKGVTLMLNRAEGADTTRLGIYLGEHRNTEWVAISKEQAEALAAALLHWARLT